MSASASVSVVLLVRMTALTSLVVDVLVGMSLPTLAHKDQLVSVGRYNSLGTPTLVHKDLLISAAGYDNPLGAPTLVHKDSKDHLVLGGRYNVLWFGNVSSQP